MTERKTLQIRTPSDDTEAPAIKKKGRGADRQRLRQGSAERAADGVCRRSAEAAGDLAGRECGVMSFRTSLTVAILFAAAPVGASATDIEPPSVEERLEFYRECLTHEALKIDDDEVSVEDVIQNASQAEFCELTFQGLLRSQYRPVRRPDGMVHYILSEEEMRVQNLILAHRILIMRNLAARRIEYCRLAECPW